MNKKSIFKDGVNKNLTHSKEQKGITLIALIITIVVLLILAAVAINAITEYNIIENANSAAQKYGNKAQEEETILGNYDTIINQYLGTSTGENDSDEGTGSEGGDTQVGTKSLTIKDLNPAFGALYFIDKDIITADKSKYEDNLWCEWLGSDIVEDGVVYKEDGAVLVEGIKDYVILVCDCNFSIESNTSSWGNCTVEFYEGDGTISTTTHMPYAKVSNIQEGAWINVQLWD